MAMSKHRFVPLALRRRPMLVSTLLASLVVTAVPVPTWAAKSASVVSPAVAAVPLVRPQGNVMRPPKHVGAGNVVRTRSVPRQRMPRVERWTPVSHEVTAPSGKTRVRVFSAPKFRRTASGWKPLHTRVQRGQGRFPVKLSGVAVPSSFGSARHSLLRLEIPRGRVDWRLRQARRVDPLIARRSAALTRLKYAEIRPGVDLVYDVTSARTKEQLVIKSGDAAHSFAFVVRDPRHLLGDVTAQGRGGYTFSGSVGDGLTLSLSSPMAWSKRTGSMNSSVPGDGSAFQRVTKTRNGYLVRIGVDRGWARNLRYPIVLDPTQSYSWDGETLGTAFAPVNPEACGDPCQLASMVDGSFFIGWNDNVTDMYETTFRGLLHADLSNIPPSTDITSAEITLGAEDPPAQPAQPSPPAL